MNKRIKKKRELVSQVQGTKEAVDIVLGIIKNLTELGRSRPSSIGG